MLKIAIVGNIASGKSTIENYIRELGYTVYDSDKISHDILAGSFAVRKMFADDDILTDGQIDRKKLGKIAFASTEKMNKLNSICQEYIEKTVDEIISKMEEGKVVHYILDKYQDQLRLLKDNDLYNYNDWEKIFGQQSYITFNSNVSRKMGIVNREADGLLVLLQIILETVAQREFE